MVWREGGERVVYSTMSHKVALSAEPCRGTETESSLEIFPAATLQYVCDYRLLEMAPIPDHWPAKKVRDTFLDFFKERRHA